jgi:hypothetical protein
MFASTAVQRTAVPNNEDRTMYSYSTADSDFLTFGVGKGEVNGITNVFVNNNPGGSESVSGAERN